MSKNKERYWDYLGSEAWKIRRDMALERDGRRCRLCNSKDRLEVHHRTYKRRGNEKLDDLTTLCNKCHSAHHNRQPAEPKKRRRRSREEVDRKAFLDAIDEMDARRRSKQGDER